MKTSNPQTVLDFLKSAYQEYEIDYRESQHITGSYDFAIDTGTARIILNVTRAFWEDNENESIINYLEAQELRIRKALSNNQNVSLQIG